MTNTKAAHTPGPWHLTGSVHDHKDGPTWLITVFADNGPEWGKITAEAIAPTREMATANALLIAAAPDLLAACERLAELLGSMGPITGDPKMFKIRVDGAEYLAQPFRELEAAIAKARGGE